MVCTWVIESASLAGFFIILPAHTLRVSKYRCVCVVENMHKHASKGGAAAANWLVAALNSDGQLDNNNSATIGYNDNLYALAFSISTKY